jgi:hypothetical protein
MTSLDRLKSIFEALLPERVIANPPGGPTLFEQFGSVPKEAALNLCAEWKLTAEQGMNFWYVWDHHPANVARSSQPGK